jgi:hypothetical protein
MADPTPLACNLGALSADEQHRRAALADDIAAVFREVRETEDGYAARIDDDPALCRRALEWLLLERRCCPFLDLRLVLEGERGPVWIHFRGGPGVKAFLAAAGLAARAAGGAETTTASRGCSC